VTSRLGHAYHPQMRTSLVILLAGGLNACLDPPPTVADFCAPPVGDSPTRGPADAWVTMVEFADFQCPYCGRATATLSDLEIAYPTDLRLVFKHFPLSFHPHAMDAALAAECAREQDRFWEMHDLLFAHQARLEMTDLESYAGQAGVDLDVWRGCFASDAPRGRIAADKELGLEAGISGTPTFFVNGEVIEGAAPTADFRRLIDAVLATAEASGVAREDYYAGLEGNACH
jgi:protein-disulfide isomerase